MSTSQEAVVISSSISGASAKKITFRLPVSALGIRPQSAQRFIFALGPWSASGAQAHAARDVTARFVNIAAGTIIPVTGADNGTGALIWVILATLAYGVVSIIVAHFNRKVETRRWRLAAAFSFLVLMTIWMLGAILWGTYANFRGYSLNSSVARTFGFLTSAGFWFLLWPMTRTVGFARSIRSSFERTLPYHALFGVLVWCTMTTHFIMMLTLVRLDVVGLLAWIASTLQVIIALFLRHKFYHWFRVMHVALFLTVIILGCIHHVNVIIFLSLPVFLYGLDLGYRFVLDGRGAATITAAEYDPLRPCKGRTASFRFRSIKRSMCLSSQGESG